MKITHRAFAIVAALSLPATAHANHTPGTPQGWLDVADCDQFAGWAAYSELPDYASLPVTIWVDGRSLLHVQADQYRADLQAAGYIGKGAHGFSVKTPAALFDGRPHIVSATAGTGTPLSQHSQPMTLTCGVQQQPLGYLDVFNCDQIAGWAWDPGRGDAPVSVEIFFDRGVQGPGTQIPSIVADTYRPDLQAAGMGNGRHSFFIPTPAYLRDGKTHSIWATFSGVRGDFIQLTNNAGQMSCPAQ